MTRQFSSFVRTARNQNKSIHIATIAIVVITLFLLARGITSSKTQSNSNVRSSTSNSTKGPINIEGQIDIPLGSSDSSINYQLVSVRLSSEIVLKGQKAVAVEGKKFLLVDIKLSNNEQQRIQIDTRDYLRLAVEGSEDRLAPQVHNDPVEVQPISDQFTRVGFSVKEDTKNFTLYLGEISQDKNEIPVSFQ